MPAVLDSPAAVRRAAMDLLARREHSRAELSRKLRQRGAFPELIDPALERLAEEGLLSDTRYLESLVRKRALAGYGPLRIREELAQSGLGRAEVERVLEGCGFDWQAQAEQAWQRKFAGVVPADVHERARQARFLAYRGYSAEQINRLWHRRDE